MLDKDYDEMPEEDINLVNNKYQYLLDNGFKPATKQAVVYALFLDGVCQYIGSSFQFGGGAIRIHNHWWTKKFKFDKILIKNVTSHSRLTEEALLISLLEPVHNIDHTTKPPKPRMTKDELKAEVNKLKDFINRQKEAPPIK